MNGNADARLSDERLHCHATVCLACLPIHRTPAFADAAMRTSRTFLRSVSSTNAAPSSDRARGSSADGHCRSYSHHSLSSSSLPCGRYWEPRRVMRHSSRRSLGFPRVYFCLRRRYRPPVSRSACRGHRSGGPRAPKTRRIVCWVSSTSTCLHSTARGRGHSRGCKRR